MIACTLKYLWNTLMSINFVAYFTYHHDIFEDFSLCLVLFLHKNTFVKSRFAELFFWKSRKEDALAMRTHAFVMCQRYFSILAEESLKVPFAQSNLCASWKSQKWKLKSRRVKMSFPAHSFSPYEATVVLKVSKGSSWAARGQGAFCPSCQMLVMLNLLNAERDVFESVFSFAMVSFMIKTFPLKWL